MASAIPSAPLTLRPLLIPHHRTRFLKIGKYLERKWILNNNNATSTFHRLSNLHRSHSPPLHISLPLRSRVPLSRPALCALLGPRSSTLRSSLSSMIHPQQASESSKTVRVVIKGRVQGVFYRNWTIENATQLGLKGWVRNRRDGSVEALFSGTPEKVQEMEQRCRRGPPDAMVTGLQVFPSTDDPGTGFELKRTE